MSRYQLLLPRSTIRVRAQDDKKQTAWAGGGIKMLLISGWERRKRRTQRPFAVAAARAPRQQCRVTKSEYDLACRRSESDKQAQDGRTHTDKQRNRYGGCRQPEGQAAVRQKGLRCGQTNLNILHSIAIAASPAIILFANPKDLTSPFFK